MRVCCHRKMCGGGGGEARRTLVKEVIRGVCFGAQVGSGWGGHLGQEVQHTAEEAAQPSALEETKAPLAWRVGSPGP